MALLNYVKLVPESSAMITAVFRVGTRDTAVTTAMREHDGGSSVEHSDGSSVPIGRTDTISGRVDFLSKTHKQQRV
jgi:hypothetical protein